jgi:hypothetical protein
LKEAYQNFRRAYTMTGRQFLFAVPLALLIPATASQAASSRSWDGTWAGLLNKSEPVSITIMGGKVVGYAIRGGAPFGIEYSKVTLTTVSFGDRDNYKVEITKTGATTALGKAHSPMGDGSASLTKQ